MNTQIFDQISFNVKTLQFIMYIKILGSQEQFNIPHMKAQFLIEDVNLSSTYKIDTEITKEYIYYIPTKKQG
jgi:hypothetical protein